MSFTASHRERMTASIPLASMIDIIFLLLAFFIMASTFRDYERQIAVSLPATETSRAEIGERTQIVITVKEDGTVLLGDLPIRLDDLRAKLGQLAREFPDESVIIRGDKESRYGTVVTVMDFAYGAGLRNVSVATTKPESEVGR